MPPQLKEVFPGTLRTSLNSTGKYVWISMAHCFIRGPSFHTCCSQTQTGHNIPNSWNQQPIFNYDSQNLNFENDPSVFFWIWNIALGLEENSELRRKLSANPSSPPLHLSWVPSHGCTIPCRDEGICGDLGKVPNVWGVLEELFPQLWASRFTILQFPATITALCAKEAVVRAVIHAAGRPLLPAFTAIVPAARCWEQMAGWHTWQRADLPRTKGEGLHAAGPASLPDHVESEPTCPPPHSPSCKRRFFTLGWSWTGGIGTSKFVQSSHLS